MTEYLSTTDVMQKLKVSGTKVRHLISTGALKATRSGRNYRIRPEDLQEYMDSIKISVSRRSKNECVGLSQGDEASPFEINSQGGGYLSIIEKWYLPSLQEDDEEEALFEDDEENALFKEENEVDDTNNETLKDQVIDENDTKRFFSEFQRLLDNIHKSNEEDTVKVTIEENNC